jgi:polar amino acid transport system substrate-binding protein
MERAVNAYILKKIAILCSLAAFVLCISSPFAWADLLSDIKKKGEIVIGTEARFAPYEYVENGEIVGYSADLLTLIMADMPEVKVTRLDIPWQGILPGLSAKKFDYIVTSVSATPERAQRYALSVPIADATVAMLVRDNSAFQTVENLAGKTVGSQTGSAQMQSLLALDKSLQDKGLQGITIKEYVSFDEAYADLASGRLQGVAQSYPSLSDIIKKRPGMFRVITPPFGEKVYVVWAARKDEDSAALADFFNQGLAGLIAGGKMAELQQKWFGFSMPVQSEPISSFSK